MLRTTGMILGLFLAAWTGAAVLAAGGKAPRIGDPAPDFSGNNPWINSQPVTIAELRGKVLLVEFWTYG